MKTWRTALRGYDRTEARLKLAGMQESHRQRMNELAKELEEAERVHTRLTGSPTEPYATDTADCGKYDPTVTSSLVETHWRFSLEASRAARSLQRLLDDQRCEREKLTEEKEALLKQLLERLNKQTTAEAGRETTDDIGS